MRQFPFVRAVVLCCAVALPFAAAANAGDAVNATAPVKLHQTLFDVAQYATSQKTLPTTTATANIAAFAKERRLTVQGRKILVEIFLADTSAKSIARLTKYGIVHDNGFGRLNKRLQAFVPADKLVALAGERRVNWVQPPSHAHAEVTSEGVAKTYADTYISHSPAWSGAGVKVAIIDLGFSGYAAKLGTELPAAVTTKSFRADGDLTGGGETHGTACAEVVHDMAPDAVLYLLNFNTDVELNSAVNYCIAQGVKVISHSIGWTNMSFYDGTGDLKTIVDNANNAGILWCNSSGNEQQRHWDGTFSDPDANGWMNMSGADEDIDINLSAGNACTLEMTWDQWPLASTDFDLYLYRDVSGSLVQVASSTTVQNGTQPPTESIGYTPASTGLYHIKIKRKTGAASPRLAIFCYEYDFAEYKASARSLMDPSPVANAFAVGAVNVSTDVIESFSSLGPTEDGRTKPEISAPDCNTNSVYGSFCGTSSACPHTAGAAALLLSENGTRTVAQLKTILVQNALDLGATGTDNSYGAGRLRLPDVTAPSAPSVTSSTHTAGTWSNASTVAVSWPASTDTWSGMLGYSYVWDHSPATVPNLSVEGTATSFNAALGDARDWYFHVRAVDVAGNGSAAAHFGPVKIDATAPQTPLIVSVDPAGAGWSTRDTIKASWSDTDLVSGMNGYVVVVDRAPSTVVSSGLTAPATSIATAVADGLWYMHIAGRDSAGNWSPTLNVGPYHIDHTPPTTPALQSVDPLTRTWTNKRHVHAAWMSSDTLSGMLRYRWVWDTLAAPVRFTDSATSASLVSPALTDGKLWMVHVQSLDSAGNASTIAHAGPFYIDSTAPTAPTIASTTPPARTWTRNAFAQVRYTGARDATSGVKGMAVAWDTVPSTTPTAVTWVSDSTLTSTALPDGRNWYAHLRTVDSAGNASAVVHAGPFFIDATAPLAPLVVSSSIPAGTWWNGSNVDSLHWRIDAADTSGLGNFAGYSWQWSNNSAAPADSTIDGLADNDVKTLGDGRWYFSVRAADSAGNWSAAQSAARDNPFGPILVDRTPPTATMRIANGAEVITTTRATVDVTAFDATSGIARGELRSDSTVIPLPFSGSAASVVWDLRDPRDGAQPGWHYLTCQVWDSAQNASPLLHDSVFYAPSGIGDPAVHPGVDMLAVFPNPTSGGPLRIDVGSAAFPLRVSIVDVLGRTVSTMEYRTAVDVVTLDAGVALPEGVYECRAESQKHLRTAVLTVVR